MSVSDSARFTVRDRRCRAQPTSRKRRCVDARAVLPASRGEKRAHSLARPDIQLRRPRPTATGECEPHLRISQCLGVFTPCADARHAQPEPNEWGKQHKAEETGSATSTPVSSVRRPNPSCRSLCRPRSQLRRPQTNGPPPSAARRAVWRH